MFTTEVPGAAPIDPPNQEESRISGLLPEWRYAASLGADIVNMSFTGHIAQSASATDAEYFEEIAAVRRLLADGYDPNTLYTTSAGNERRNLDTFHIPNPGRTALFHVPDNVDNPLHLVVAATNNADQFSDFWLGCGPTSRAGPFCIDMSSAQPGSNFGATTVHVAAPGDRVSTLRDTGGTIGVSGTSYAAPMTAAVAGLGLSRFASAFRHNPLSPSSA